MLSYFNKVYADGRVSIVINSQTSKLQFRTGRERAASKIVSLVESAARSSIFQKAAKLSKVAKVRCFFSAMCIVVVNISPLCLMGLKHIQSVTTGDYGYLFDETHSQRGGRGHRGYYDGQSSPASEWSHMVSRGLHSSLFLESICKVDLLKFIRTALARLKTKKIWL